MFIDLSKVFDKVDHTILLKKLEIYSVRGNTHKWIKNFLSIRRQCIEIDLTTKTSLEQVKCGVPQGSILATL